MSGWVKWEKDLETDPRTKRMVKGLKSLCNVHALPDAALVTLVCGGLLRMWSYADSHIRSDDTLDMSSAEVDEYVGIEGFCSVIPPDWLVILDENTVQLPDYQKHNGVEAKKRALTQKRVEKHRNKERNAPALPDQTRPEETRPDQKEREAHAQAPPSGIREMGTGLTVIHAIEDWRRDVPECNPEAFASWIVHCELAGKMLGQPQRMMQARQLAKNGGFPEQAEVVEFCIAQGWKTLVPLNDVRRRRDGMSRAGPSRAPHAASPTTAELEAREAARVR